MIFPPLTPFRCERGKVRKTPNRLSLTNGFLCVATRCNYSSSEFEIELRNLLAPQMVKTIAREMAREKFGETFRKLTSDTRKVLMYQIGMPETSANSAAS